MHCIVTAGPTYEALDDVRRLTNFSTGRLGSELATYLSDHGHEVTLLIGQQATYRGERKAARVITFGNTASLQKHLKDLGGPSADGVYHAAAVSDFAFGQVWCRSERGDLIKIESGKFSTRQGTLLAELVPTPKIISQLRNWFPTATLVGWKYEVDGTRQEAIQLGRSQIKENRTNACVVNGTAYGAGFGVVLADGNCSHVDVAQSLYARLEQLLTARKV